MQTRLKSAFAAAAACAALAVLSPAAGADEVHLSNGRVLEASRIDKTGRAWTLTTDFGRIQVLAHDVVKVVPSKRTSGKARTPIQSSGRLPAAPTAGSESALPPATRLPVPPAADSSSALAGTSPGADPPPDARRCTPPPWPVYGEVAGTEDPASDVAIARSEDTAARLALVRRLAAQADPADLPLLLELGGDGIVVVRRAALEALGAFDDPEALAGLLRASLADDPFAQEPALAGIGAWYRRNRELEDFSLAGAIGALDPESAAALLLACARVDRTGTRDMVKRFLDTGRTPLRAAAIRALRWHMDKALKAQLPVLLEDREPVIRTEAAVSAAVLRYKDGIPRLIAMLGDPDPKVAQAAHASLKLLSGVPLPADATAWRTWLQNRPARR